MPNRLFPGLPHNSLAMLIKEPPGFEPEIPLIPMGSDVLLETSDNGYMIRLITHEVHNNKVGIQVKLSRCSQISVKPFPDTS